MPLVVEHDKRRKEILEKAFDIFIEEGFENVTLQMIASECGITRTLLYSYFKNKQDIFSYSIKQLTDEVEKRISAYSKDPLLNSIEALKKTVDCVLDTCSANYKLFYVLLPYLLNFNKESEDYTVRIRHRIIKLRHILSYIIINGIKKGEIKNDKVKEINDTLYTLIEGAVLNIAILKQQDVEETKKVASFTIDKITQG